MSGIYIPGERLPKTLTAMWIFPDGDVAVFGRNEDITRIRKAIPVPDHGRLIDADALTGQMERNLWAIEDKAEKELGFDETLRRGIQYGHAVCVDAVNAAPTIIPADKEAGE